MMSKLLLPLLFILLPVLAIPNCITDPSYEMNVTMTNMTPIMETMTIDIKTNQTSGTSCLIRIYDQNTSIMTILPGTLPRDETTPQNAIQELLSSQRPRLIVSPSGTTYQDVRLWPWIFREDYPYTLYVECGTSCDSSTFYVDSPRFIVGERLTENTMMSFIKNPTYTIFSFLVGIFILSLFFKLLKRF